MSCGSRFISNPFTTTTTGEAGELTILADNGAPAVEADCNVIFVNGTNDKAPYRISLMGRISGTAEAAAVVTISWYVFHHKTQQFYQAANMTVTGSAGFTATQGNILFLNHNPQCQKGYVEATGLAANQDLHVVVDEVE